jgi:hypothetical protein
MAARRAPGATVPADDPTIVKTGRTKLLHTAEQLEHLLDLGLVDQRLAPVAEEARRLSDAVPADRLTDLAALDPSDDLLAHYNRLIHVEEERPIPGGALSRGRDWSAVEGAFGDGGDQAVRLDDLLTPEAHEGIRRFATRSTIWFENRYAEEVGGRLAMGLACPLLFQVAGELRDALPDLLGPLRLRTIFGYVYYQSGSDGHLHADQGVLDDRQAVSLNYWVTPDEANLDPGQGGLTVWNRRAPEAYFKEPDAATRRAMLEAELSKPGTARRRIPYAGNRAMLFRSDILHKSEPMTFREGLLNRRVSLTFIFGARR